MTRRRGEPEDNGGGFGTTESVIRALDGDHRRHRKRREIRARVPLRTPLGLAGSRFFAMMLPVPPTARGHVGDLRESKERAH